MFKNMKVTAHMRTPVAAIDPIILDSIISAAKAKEILEEDYYTGENIAGEIEDVKAMLGTILDRKQGVFCTSIGIGDSREYVGSWTKRWNAHDDDLVRFGGRKRKRVDIGSGFYKNYHMPLVLNSYKEIIFYARGDKEEIERLLNSYIHYIGKKGSQGYGQVNKWTVDETTEDWSLWKDNRPMRPIPADKSKDYIEKLMKEEKNIEMRQHPTVPPYWREEKELCIMPGGIE